MNLSVSKIKKMKGIGFFLRFVSTTLSTSLRLTANIVFSPIIIGRAFSKANKDIKKKRSNVSDILLYIFIHPLIKSIYGKDSIDYNAYEKTKKSRADIDAENERTILEKIQQEAKIKDKASKTFRNYLAFRAKFFDMNLINRLNLPVFMQAYSPLHIKINSIFSKKDEFKSLPNFKKNMATRFMTRIVKELSISRLVWDRGYLKKNSHVKFMLEKCSEFILKELKKYSAANYQNLVEDIILKLENFSRYIHVLKIQGKSTKDICEELSFCFERGNVRLFEMANADALSRGNTDTSSSVQNSESIEYGVSLVREFKDTLKIEKNSKDADIFEGLENRLREMQRLAHHCEVRALNGQSIDQAFINERIAQLKALKPGERLLLPIGERMNKELEKKYKARSRTKKRKGLLYKLGSFFEKHYKKTEDLMLKLFSANSFSNELAVCEIIKINDKEFDFNIYNAGQGMQEYHQKSAGLKNKYLPVMRLRNVSCERLLNRDVIEMLYSQPLNKESHEQSQNSLKFLYEGIVPYLGGERVYDAIEDIERYMTPSRSKNNGMRTVNAYIKAALQDNPGLYKRFKFIERIKSITSLLNSVDLKNPEVGLRNHAVLKDIDKAIKKITSAAIKLKKKGYITKKEEEMLYELQNKAKEKADKAKEASDKSTPGFKLSKAGTKFTDISKLFIRKTSLFWEFIILIVKGIIKIKGLIQSKTKKEPEKVFSDKIKHLNAEQLSQITPSNIREKLKDFEERIQYLSKNFEANKNEIHFLLSDILKSLPVVSANGNFWSNVPDGDVTPVRDAIYKLNQEFFKSCYNRYFDNRSAYVNTLNTFAVIFELSKRAADSKAFLEGFELGAEGNIKNLRRFLNTAFAKADPVEIHRIRELIKYFEKSNSKKSHRAAYREDDLQQNTRRLNFNIHFFRSNLIKSSDIADINLMKKILSANPNLRYNLRKLPRVFDYGILRRSVAPNPGENDFAVALFADPNNSLLPVWCRQLKSLQRINELFSDQEYKMPCGRYIEEFKRKIVYYPSKKSRMGGFYRISCVPRYHARYTMQNNLFKIKFGLQDVFSIEIKDKHVKRVIENIIGTEYRNNYFLDSEERHENDILIDRMREILASKLSPKKARELALIRTGGMLQICNTIDFFTKNIDLLKEGEYQLYSLLCFFEELENGYMSDDAEQDYNHSTNMLINDYPAIISKLDEFLSFGFINSGNNVSLVLYFAALKNKVEKYLEFAKVQNMQKAPSQRKTFPELTCPDFTSRLESIFKQPTTSNAEKTRIARAIVESAGKDIEKIIKKEKGLGSSEIKSINIQKMAAAKKIVINIFNVFRLSGHVKSEDSDNYRMLEIVHKHRATIIQMLNNGKTREELLAFIIKDFGISQAERFEFDIEALTFKSKHFLISISDGCVYKDGVPLKGMSQDITYSHKYKELFEGKERSFWFNGECFESSDHEYKIKKLGSSIDIFRKIPTNGSLWYKYISEAEIAENLDACEYGDKKYPQCFLDGSFKFWLSCKLGSKHILVFDENDKIKYKINLRTNKIIKTDEKGNETDFVLENIYGTFEERERRSELNKMLKFLPKLAEFEDRRYILKFQNKKGDSILEFTRLGLVFESCGGKMFLKSMPGFFISETQKIPSLGSFNTYLVLENDRGQKKIIVSFQKCKDYKEMMEGAFLPQLGKNETIDEEKLVYVLDVDSELKIKPAGSSNEESLAVVFSYLAAENYNECIKYLKKSWQNKIFSERAFKLIENICNPIALKMLQQPWDMQLLGSVDMSIKIILSHLGDELEDAKEPWDPRYHALMYNIAFMMVSSLKSSPANCENANMLEKSKEIILKTLPFINRYIQNASNVPSYLLLKPEEELETLTFIKKLCPLEPIVLKRIEQLSNKKEQRTLSYDIPEENFVLKYLKADVRFGEESPESLAEKMSFINLRQDESRSYRKKHLKQKVVSTFKEKLDEKKKMRPEMKYLLDCALKAYSENTQATFILKLNTLLSENQYNLSPYEVKALVAACLCGYSNGKDIARYYLEHKNEIIKRVEAYRTIMQSSAPRTVDGVNIEFENYPFDQYEHPTVAPSFPGCACGAMPLKEIADKYFTIRQSTPTACVVDFGQFSTDAERGIGDRLIDGLRAVARQRETVYSFTGKLSSLKINLAELKTKEASQSKKLLEDILRECNKRPDTAQALQERQELIAQKREAIDLDDIILFILKKDKNILRRKNRFLSDEDINKIYFKMLEYMTKELKIKQIDSIFTVIEDLEGAQDESGKKQLIQKLGQEICQKRHFDLSKEPDLLIFEYFAGMLIRGRNIDLYRQFTKDDKNLIIQLIMGGGKTKVLMPLLAMSMMKGKTLPIILVPASMYQTNHSDLQALLGKLGKKVYSFDFRRDFEFSLENLKAVKENFEKAKSGHGCFISTPESVQSLVLKYVEMLYIITDKRSKGEKVQDELIEKAKMLQSILQILHKNSTAIIDEVDTILDCRKELNYTIGQPDSYSQVRWTFPSEIYGFLEELGYMPNKDGFTEEFYQNNIMPKLADKLTDYLFEEFQKVRKGLITKEELKQYILKQSNSLPVMNLLKDTNRELCEKVELARSYTSSILKFTLTKKHYVNYGPCLKADGTKLRGDYEFAIPYKGNMTPSEGSEFGHPDVVFAFTYQDILLRGLTLDQTKRIIRVLQGDFDEDVNINEACDCFKGTLLDKSKVMNINLDNEQDVKNIHNAIFKDKKIIYYYYNLFIFHKLKKYSQRLSSNPLDISGVLFARKLGFTGTPNNKDVYSEEIGKSVKSIPEDDGKVLRMILDREITSVSNIKDTNGESFIKDLAERPDFNQYRAIIDTGAYFKGISNKNVVDMLINVFKKRGDIEGVVYFDDLSNEIMVKNVKTGEVEKLTVSKIPPERRFTYYDQIHTTGTDIKQASLAKAYMTIGRNISTRDIFQSAMRLRELGAGQKLTLLVPAYLNTLKSAKDIIVQAIKDEARQLTRDIDFSDKQKAKDRERRNAFERILSKDVDDISDREDFNVLIEEIDSDLLSQAKKREDDENLGVEVQQEQEQQQEKQKEQEKQIMLEPEFDVESYSQLRFSTDLKVASNEFFEYLITGSYRWEATPKISPLNEIYDIGFDSNIYATENFFKTAWGASIEDECVNRYMKTCCYYLEVLKRGEREPKFLLLSRQDAKILLAKILNEPPSKDIQVILRNADGKVVEETQLEGEEILQEQEKIRYENTALAQLKFLQGETNFSSRHYNGKAVREELKRWFERFKNDIETIVKRYKFNAELRRNIYSESIYEHSFLSRLFNEYLDNAKAQELLSKKEEPRKKSFEKLCERGGISFENQRIFLRRITEPFGLDREH